MNDSGQGDGASAAASRQLHQLHQLRSETEAARLQLSTLQHDVMEAEQRLGAITAPQVVEANEHLVLAMLRAHADAEVAAQKLKEVARAAEIDALTELPNRTLLMDRFKQAIANAQRRHDRLAVLYVDLNDFKLLNDTYGHAVGDQALKRAAECMQSAVRKSDTVSRHGGDEFLVLLAEVSRLSDVVPIAEKILTALRTPSMFGKQILSLTASIGISIFPDDGDNADVLIDCADAAMYRAKRDRLIHPAFYEPSFLPAGNRSDLVTAESTSEMPSVLSTAGRVDRRNVWRRGTDASLALGSQDAHQVQYAAECTQRRHTEFLAVLAHEQRNALGPIRHAAALLGRLPINEPLLPRMQAIIERQVVYIARLVDDVLDISRVRTGKLRMEWSRVDLNHIARQAAESCRGGISARGQRLALDIPNVPIELFGDPVRLAQIFSNLLDNASKYSPNDTAIALSVRSDCGEGVITIIDHGIGIAEGILPTIFDLFVQDTSAISFAGDGLGIGLTVVRELVAAHGGTVAASSAGVNAGATFVVKLPLTNAAVDEIE